MRHVKRVARQGIFRIYVGFREQAGLSFQLMGRLWASCLMPVSLHFLMYIMKENASYLVCS